MKYIQRLVLLATMGLTFSSCDKFIEGYDVNPNLPQDAPAEQQLTAVQINEGFVLSGEMTRVAGIWSDYFTGADRQYQGLDVYTTAAGDYDNMWANTYQLTLANARLVQDKARAVNNFYLLGIAQVLEAQMIGTATALWGDVPYSEAFRPNQPPKFDSQASVYAAVQTLLDQAIQNLGKTGINPGDRDIYYGGDLGRWQAAAHSLKARYYLHTKNYQQAAVEARLGIGSPDGDMLMPYNGNFTVDANPYADFLDYNRVGYMSAEGAYAVDLLDPAGSTPRANAKTNEAGRFNYFYTTNGYFSVDPNFLDGAFAPDADFPLMSYVETQAILAEALARTGDAGGALIALNNIRSTNAAFFAQIDPAADYDAYTLTDFAPGGIINGGAATANDALLKEILTEKYLSLVGQIEPFNDIRRTNNLIGVPKKNANSPNLPQRYLIAQSEVNTNPKTPAFAGGVLFEKTPINR
ncbi:SusD/RagB family nutrient-binding outer membrane lipoprotein [Hymenobacter sp. B81]|uniref:SusD/RagB family nutrient-binding outer membrane lipoprotein n=1 Tax=Hymenobacter sp. B81 TaxID=3344878 RepID=UPI0037DCC6F3